MSGRSRKDGWAIAQADTQVRLAKKFGIATIDELRIAPCGYDWELIARDVNALLNRRCDLPVGNKDTFPESFVDYMAGIYLSCCRIEGVPPSEELLHLACQQLDTASFGRHGADPNSDALARAQQMRFDNSSISNKAIAKDVGVEPSTVGRWEKQGKLERKSA